MPVDSVTWHAVGQIHKASSHLKHSVTPSSQREARRPQNESLWNKFSEHNLIFSTALHSSIYSLDPLMSLIPGGHNLEWYCQLGKCNGFHSRGFTDSFILFYFFPSFSLAWFFFFIFFFFSLFFFSPFDSPMRGLAVGVELYSRYKKVIEYLAPLPSSPKLGQVMDRDLYLFDSNGKKLTIPSANWNKITREN